MEDVPLTTASSPLSVSPKRISRSSITRMARRRGEVVVASLFGSDIMRFSLDSSVEEAEEDASRRMSFADSMLIVDEEVEEGDDRVASSESFVNS